MQRTNRINKAHRVPTLTLKLLNRELYTDTRHKYTKRKTQASLCDAAEKCSKYYVLETAF